MMNFYEIQRNWIWKHQNDAIEEVLGFLTLTLSYSIEDRVNEKAMLYQMQYVRKKHTLQSD